MSIRALADRLITVYRRTSLVLDSATVAASMAPTRQPAAPAMIEVVLTGGTSATGTVTVAGTVGGVASTETLTFTGPARKAGIKRFSALTGFTTTGLADEAVKPTIEASAVGGDGSAIHASVLVVSSWPMRHDIGRPAWPAPAQGSTEQEDAAFYMDYTATWTPREGDVFVDARTSEEWHVIGPPTQHGGGRRVPHHYEIRVQRREGSRLAV